MSFSKPNRLACILAALLGAAPFFPAHALPDRILMFDGHGYSQADLPAGAGGETQYLSSDVDEVLALPSGRLLALTRTPAPERRIALNEVGLNGHLVQLGLLPLPDFAFESDRPVDSAVDSRGRAYFLLRARTAGELETRLRLVEVDPVTGATVRVKNLGVFIHAITTAPQGLWALSQNHLHRLDPDTGELGPALREMPATWASHIAADSAGRLWFVNEIGCIPEFYCYWLGWVDPVTGAFGQAPTAMFSQTPDLQNLAVVRRCADSATSRCLQGGRFLAEIEYRAYDGAAGPAKAAPERSADTAIFSFFDPDNWELMVKVLDGCAINSNFWVYASASTDVEYTMTITDTETGAEKVYRNSLGQVARTVTDGNAFPCSP